MDEAITFRCASLVLCNLAAQNVSECRECVVHGLVVDCLIQVLDEDVPDPRFAQGWVALTPHNADGTAFDQIEIHCVENAFGCNKMERNQSQ